MEFFAYHPSDKLRRLGGAPFCCEMRRYFTVALTALLHFCPAVLTAKTPKRCLPEPRATVVLSWVVLPVYFFAPSTHTSMRSSVPEALPEADTSSGEVTVEPLAGVQMWTPSVAGALHSSGTTERASGGDGMVNGDPGAGVMDVDLTAYT